VLSLHFLNFLLIFLFSLIILLLHLIHVFRRPKFIFVTEPCNNVSNLFIYQINVPIITRYFLPILVI